ncbi:MAG TPA: type II secretion system F family protein [Acidobacteriota bacterium]|nr:type II secretion system F family protein [Acidobacteriota bacterium]
MVHPFFHYVARKFPNLYVTLQQAEMQYEPAIYIRKILSQAVAMALAITLSCAMILSVFKKPFWPLIIILPLFFCLSFLNMLKMPDVVVMRKRKDIDKDILFVGKFLIVEIKSGVPIYDALKNIARDYDGIGKYFKKIVDDVDVGTSVEEAITKAIVLNPSENFQKVMWQIVNSIQTGADISISLTTVLDQINKKQLIEVERYGKKLNPIAMFYLMIAVIFPSLGMVMVVVLISFADLKLSLSALLGIALVVTSFQYMFFSIIKGARPAVDM